MRRIVLPFSALFGLLTVALAAISLSAGCSDSLHAAGAERDNSQEAPGPPQHSPPSLGGTDASVRSPQYVRGSPLCGVSADQHCVPDDDGTGPADAGATCATPANAAEADTSITSACRIRSADGTRAPHCFVDEADRRGVDGVQCESGADCAPGFECIDSDRGGVCRRYCCNPDSCTSHVSMNGGPTFCDIQKVVAADAHKAPVCMPLKKCKLLHEGECSELETCAIVTEQGDIGCVPTGSAEVGDPCDEEHCQRGLTCLGSPGGRRCFQLCKTDGNDCGPGQTCTTGAVFQNTAFGVCRDAR